jgi:hypothetical protein
VSGQLEDQLIRAAPPCCGVSTFDNALQCGSEVRINSNSFSPTDGVILPNHRHARGLRIAAMRLNAQPSTFHYRAFPDFGLPNPLEQSEVSVIYAKAAKILESLSSAK